MGINDIKLTTAEIGTLWMTYIQNSAMWCFYKHFLRYLQDVEIKTTIEEALHLVETHNKKIKMIFTKENIPVPKGFTEKDIDLTAPALFTDLYALSFVYRGGQMIVPHYASVLVKVARQDVVNLFEECLVNETKLYRKSLDLMQTKGIYDRPPKIQYPNEVSFTRKHPSLLDAWLGDGAPLNSIELSELFLAIERNSIGLLLLIGLLQVTRDKDVKDYLLKGKKLAEKQVETYNTILKKNEVLWTYPVTMEVTTSTISPFSEKLILFIISSSNQIAINALAYSMTVTMRRDVVMDYSVFIMEILKYGNEGQKLLIERGWLEQPPQSTIRSDLYI
ncbi:MAG: DUF3231 family protein [Bacillus sp. (in: firmicutes)]